MKKSGGGLKVIGGVKGDVSMKKGSMKGGITKGGGMKKGACKV